jgi:hypothetical protein
MYFFVIVFIVCLVLVLLHRACLSMNKRRSADDSTQQQRPASTPQQPPAEELQTVQVTVPQASARLPSQVQPPPSAPTQEELQDDRKRLVKECLFRRKLEHGDSVAAIQSILAAARDLPSPAESSLTSTELSPRVKSECSICLERYKVGQTICWSKTNECDHIFHSKCIRQWMIQNEHDHCPLCRTDLMSFHSL